MNKSKVNQMMADIMREPDMQALSVAIDQAPNLEARKRLVIATMKEMDCYKDMDKQGKDGFDKMINDIMRDCPDRLS